MNCQLEPWPQTEVLLQMGETPLIRCAHNGHLKTVEFLVEHGADVNAIDLVRQDHNKFFKMHKP